MRYGICPVCQTKHSVGWFALQGYLLHGHDNPWSKRVCDGSGQQPEVVLGDSPEQWDRDEWDDAALQQDYWGY